MGVTCPKRRLFWHWCWPLLSAWWCFPCRPHPILPSGPGNLLVNGDFEEGTSRWSESYAATFLTVTAPVSSGGWAASLHKSGVAGEILYIRQDVQVIPGATYTLTGWIYKDEFAFEYALLRLDWRDSDGADLISPLITDDNPFYRHVTVGPVAAPPDASIARISAVAKIHDPSPANPVYFDNLSLTSNMIPRNRLPLLLKNRQG